MAPSHNAGGGLVGLLSLLFLLHVLPPSAYAWQNWDYTGRTPSRPAELAKWRDIWGYPSGPRGRRGHTMVLYDDTKLLLFGGRDNEHKVQHVPKTYEIVTTEGEFQFATYTENPVKDTYDVSCRPVKTCTPLDGVVGTTETCTYDWPYDGAESPEEIKAIEDRCGFVPVGQYYNDVWMYDLSCKDHAPDNLSDKSCLNSGWEVLHPGAKNGDCTIQSEKEICEVPSERWRHGAAMFNDDTMLIYGGFSYRCVDYCDDMWSFDARNNKFVEIYEIGHFNKGESPGKRWKFSLVSGFINPTTKEQTMIFFGGHNQWQHDDESGYLNDLWIYTKKHLNKRDEVPTITTGYGHWERKTDVEHCVKEPGIAWESRFDIKCTTPWPKPRGGHAAVYDAARNGLWVHGGYTTYYPYMRDDLKTGASVTTPYPTYPFFLNDLWFFNFETGVWKEYEYYGSEKPSPRSEHVLALANKMEFEQFNSIGSNDILILYGGYYDNNHYDDTWYFNIPLSRWIQKTSFVHAKWPDTCRDDLEYIAAHKDECVMLEWPDDVQRAPIKKELDGRTLYRRSDVYPFNLVEQRDYVTGTTNDWYYGLHDDPAEYLLNYVVNRLEYIDSLHDTNQLLQPSPWLPDLYDGYLIAPHAATAPNQYARELIMKDVLQDPRFDKYRVGALSVSLFNHTGKVWQRCTSAKIVPTRGKKTDGLFGRPSADISIPVPRKQRYGWDGCTMDDVDLWIYPSSRSDHTATYVPKYGLLLFYGGVGYYSDNDEPVEHQDITYSGTYPTRVLDDFWAYNIYKCNNDCSTHGTCNYGWCKCDDGYYGLDCSNSTCPGDFCYYDKITNEQICNHCCYGGYEHSDLDKYIPDLKKTYCSLTDTGSTNGVCDGYGTCHCTPPFIGEDCSIKDCKYNCSFNGYCSVEFPVSRCVCAEGYFGEYCQYFECLNNCTYPYGVCDYNTGSCNCSKLYNPFDNSLFHANMDGTDCSFMMAYCAASAISKSVTTLLLSIAVVLKLVYDERR